MTDESLEKKIYDNMVEDTMIRGRLRERWTDTVRTYLRARGALDEDPGNDCW